MYLPVRRWSRPGFLNPPGSCWPWYGRRPTRRGSTGTLRIPACRGRGRSTGSRHRRRGRGLRRCIHSTWPFWERSDGSLDLRPRDCPRERFFPPSASWGLFPQSWPNFRKWARWIQERSWWRPTQGGGWTLRGTWGRRSIHPRRSAFASPSNSCPVLDRWFLAPRTTGNYLIRKFSLVGMNSS